MRDYNVWMKEEKEKKKEREEMRRPRMRITTRDGWIGLASGFLPRDITESRITYIRLARVRDLASRHVPKAT